ncbi:MULTISPECIES: NifU family protein [Phenylobacterium]|uniref:Fe-S cluster biogenesis protein NfuA n=1 Tax=Phenylobacterium koreense TaxID=266125 RepID=A0ABV2EL16_9CAUL
MLILFERTPNPDALKFLPQMRLIDGRGWNFTRESEDVGASPLAQALFGLDSVAGVYVGEDFVTVTRTPDGEAWTTLRIQILAAIADVLGDGQPAVRTSELTAATVAASQIEAEIQDVLAHYVRPGVARDGGDIVFDRFDPTSRVLWVRMEGACGGCPSSRRTLKDAVEQIVRRYVPEVTAVAEAAAVGESRAPAWKRWLSSGNAATKPSRTVFRHNGRAIRD